MTSLKKQTISGIKWLVGSSFIGRTISLCTTVVLARILSPAVFGLYSLAFIAIDALSLFKSMGFDSALIQRKDNVGKAANTAFFVIPFFGIVLYLILSISAPMIGRFLNNQEVIGVIRALGIIFIISCFGKVPAALLEKNMQFKKVSVIEISTGFIYALTAIILAISGVGIWSLVYAYILKTIYQNTMYFIVSRWRPKFEFDRKIALEMFNFGKFLFLGGAVWFLKMNLDNLLVGKLLGVTALGLYAIAFNVANFGADYFGARVYRVIFPAYSKMQSDLGDLRKASLKVIKHISLIALPFGIAIFLLGKELLIFVYGQKWIGAVGVLRILAWAGIFNTLPAGLGGIFLACGKPKLGFWITSLQVIIFFIFITPMAKLFGINGVGVVVSISSFIAFIITLIWSMKILSINLNQIYLSFKPSLIASLSMAFAIIIFKNILFQNKFSILFHYNLIILFFLAITIYSLTLLRIERTLLKEIKELVFL